MAKCEYCRETCDWKRPVVFINFSEVVHVDEVVMYMYTHPWVESKLRRKDRKGIIVDAMDSERELGERDS